jgi:hypothetical protein
MVQDLADVEQVFFDVASTTGIELGLPEPPRRVGQLVAEESREQAAALPGPDAGDVMLF